MKLVRQSDLYSCAAPYARRLPEVSDPAIKAALLQLRDAWITLANDILFITEEAFDLALARIEQLEVRHGPNISN